MKIQTKFNIFIFSILMLVSLPIMVAHYLVLTQTTHSLYQKMLQIELSGIYSEISSSYRVIKSAGIAELEGYVTSTQQKLLEKARNYAFGKTGFIFIINNNGEVVLHPSYSAGQKLNFEFVQHILTLQQGHLTFEYQNKVYIAVFAHFPEWQWFVVLAVTQEEMFKEYSAHLEFLPMFSGLLFLGVSLFAFFMNNIYFAWVPTVLEALRRAKNGSWHSPMLVTHRGDVGVIQKTVNMVLKKCSNMDIELQQYRKALDNTIYGVLIFEPQTLRLTYVNRNVCERLGYSEQELLQMTPGCIIPQLDQENLSILLKPLESGERTEYTLEAISCRKLSRTIPVKLTLYLFTPTIGRDRVICIMSDITEQKQIEKNLQLHEARLKQALEATNDGLWELNLATGESYFSPTYYSMIGYQPYEFPASYQNWLNLLHPDDRSITEQAVKAAIDNPNSSSFEIEFRLKTKGGCWKWILGRGKIIERDEEGRALRLVGTHVDLTLHKQAQEAMRVVEERFNFAIKDFQDGLWDWNIRTNEMYLSPRWKNMLGYQEQELSNHPEEFFNRLHTDDIGSVMNRISGYLERRIASCEMTVRLRHKNGDYLWILLRGSARWDAQGKPLRLAGINTDISNSMRKFS